MRHKTDWSTLRPWLDGLWTVRWRLLIGTLLLLLTVVAGVGLLGVSGWFITATAVAVVAFDIYTPGGAIRFFALLRTVSRYVERVQNHDAILRLQTRWRLDLFARLTRLPVLATTRFQIARVLQRLTQDLDALDNLYLRILAPFAVALLSSLLLVLLIALWMPSAAALLGVGLFAAIALCAFVVAPHLRNQGASELGHSEQLRVRALDYVEAQPELLAWQAQASHEVHLEETARELLHNQQQLQRTQQRLQVGLDTLLQLAVAAMLASALGAFHSGTVSAPVAILLPFALLAMADALSALPLATILWGRVTGAAQRLNAQVEDEAGAEAVSLARQTTGGARLHKVSCSIKGTVLVHNVSLELPAHSVTLLSGPSGSGKTTIAHLIAGLRHPESGLVEAPQALTYLTQDNALLSATVADNLLLGNAQADDSALWQVLEAVELADDVEAMAEQLDTWVGDGGSRLSGGQARRLVLARALLRKEALLILDEPLNGVDEGRARRIVQRLRPWLEGRTVLWISHDKTLAPEVDQQLDSQCWLPKGSHLSA
ncbi:amino acid ABC transporter ATP-binding/permease protein [Aliidiomarina sp. Khilg15.8]